MEEVAKLDAVDAARVAAADAVGAITITKGLQSVVVVFGRFGGFYHCHICCFLFVLVRCHLWKPFSTDGITKGLQSVVVVFGRFSGFYHCRNCCFLFVLVRCHLWKPFGTDGITKGLQSVVVVFGRFGGFYHCCN